MAARKKQSFGLKARRLVGGVVFIVAVLILIALVTHSELDDSRIVGDLDSHLDPFELQYRNQGGMLGAYLSYSLIVVFGWLSFFLPLGLLLFSLRLFSSEIAERFRSGSLILFAVAVLATLVYDVHHVARATIGNTSGAIGGYLVIKLTELSIKLVGRLGSYVVAGGLILILLMTFTSAMKIMTFRFSIPGGRLVRATASGARTFFGWLISFKWFGDGDDVPAEPVEDSGHGSTEQNDRASRPVESGAAVVVADSPPVSGPAGKKPTGQKATLKRASEPVQIESIRYQYPNLDILDDPVLVGAAITPDELEMTARMLKETLETFQVTVDGPISSYPGPVITRFEFKPGAGVKVNRIVGLADDLALALRAKRIRIVAPIPGKAAVGVEIPNRNPQAVYLKEILGSDEFNNSHVRLPLALGKTIAGKPYVTDLAAMPHLLIAGATGSGKSVCINALITSLMYKLHPMQIRFVFIDPKMLELSVYSGIPHLGRPVVTNPKRAERVLSEIVVEMEKRYRRLAETSVRNIEDYNKRKKNPQERLPYIVVCVDELADLMLAATSSKVETLITRLAQMARAVGIHLILATQRPSVDVITGLIKANFPARIAFQVASKVDSRTIIDANGAEKLLGSGDMLFLNTGQPEPIRLHGAYISSDETERLVEFIKEQGLEMMTLEGISQAAGDTAEPEVDLGDPLFREACEVVIRHKQGSVSLLQRRLGIGYQRAARLIDKLEQAGVVSPFDGSKAREVMVDEKYIQTLFSGRPTGAANKSS